MHTCVRTYILIYMYYLNNIKNNTKNNPVECNKLHTQM